MKLSRKFPSLLDIARTAAVTQNIEQGLSAEQHDVQRELRSQFNLGRGSLAAGICLRWYEERREQRDMTATGLTSTTGDQGGMAVGTDVHQEIGAALRANLVLEQLGARVLGGFVGNVNFPRAAASLSCDWRSENAATGDTDEALANMSMTPHRVTASIPVSDQLLLQGAGAETFLRAELMAALAVEIQRVGICGSGAESEPTGIINTPGIGSVVGGADGAAPTYANLCDLEYAVTGTAKADRGNLGWLVSPAGRRKLRQTPIFAGGSVPIWRENEAAALLGHSAGVTPSVPDALTKGAAVANCSAIAFGEFSELFVVFFGPGVVIFAARDRTSALVGKTWLFATAYVDTGVRTPAAFAAMKDALCA